MKLLSSPVGVARENGEHFPNGPHVSESVAPNDHPPVVRFLEQMAYNKGLC